MPSPASLFYCQKFVLQRIRRGGRPRRPVLPHPLNAFVGATLAVARPWHLLLHFRRGGRLCPPARVCTAPLVNGVIAKPVRTLAVAIRVPHTPLVPHIKNAEANASVLSVWKKYFYHAAQVFKTLKKFQKPLILMVRDTLLGFPSHALPYCYHHSYHSIDRPPLSFTFSHHCRRTYPPRIYRCGCARRTTRGYPLLSCPYRRISPELGRPAHRLAAGRASGRTYAPKDS